MDALIRYGGEFLEAVIESARGAWLTTTDGRKILDFTSGQMCATLGHNHPAIVAAMRDAGDRVLHLHSGMVSPDVIQLANELVALLPDPLDRVMFLSTGGESNEAALRMAKLHTGGFEVYGLSASWHGMTAGAASSTYSFGRRGYGPPMPGSIAMPTPNPYRCPIRHCRDACDLTCLDTGMALADSQSVGSPAAVVVEPILSSGGIVPLPDGYLARLKRMADERGMLLVIDEAQTAFGRVGAMFAFVRHGVVPDILTVSKTLGGGLPVAGTVTTAAIEQDCVDKGLLFYTSHVSDPLAAVVGRAVLATLAAEALVERAATMGARLRAGLEALKTKHEAVGDVRGEGMLLGVDLVRDRDSREPAATFGAAVTDRCLALGLNVNIVKLPKMGSVLRIAPPLTITEADLDLGVEILDRALTDSASLR